ncbi:hypothetical protein FOZ63_020560 [Perkinsus olseni]|uniref:Uncharacterized protein n=1 Tax=Perkinsus olseni TaxID=32597 RepID=A0A7J6PPM7_PEROL|nr:hypothetical protein FOZ63_020560 [Perkinsus olseni]
MAKRIRTTRALKRRLIQVVQCYQYFMVQVDLPVLADIAGLLMSDDSFDLMYFPVSSGFPPGSCGHATDDGDKVIPFILDVTITAEEATLVNSEEAARNGIGREERANRVVEWLKAQDNHDSGSSTVCHTVSPGV